MWVALRRERAIRRGEIREDTDDVEDFEEEYEEYEDYDGADLEGVEGGEEITERGERVEEENMLSDLPVNETSEDRETEVIETEDGELISVKPHTWHETNFDVSIAQALVELAEVFRQEEFAGSVVGQAVIKQTEASAEEINELVSKLVNEGDYGAGQELLLFGDPAADALYAALKEVKGEQAAEDILQILGDIGTDRAYRHIAEFFVDRINRLPSDPIAVAAARTFCYVVMLTGGTPEPLRGHLRLIERLDYPELRENAEEAIQAIQEQGTEVPDFEPRSTDPFANL